MPSGERINDFDVYLGVYAVLATSAGFRVGVSDATGDIQYGPLLFRDAACTAIAFKDSYAYIATLVDGEAGLVRVDLSTTVVANDLYFLGLGIWLLLELAQLHLRLPSLATQTG
jgi:hypothetical protein